MPLWCKEEQPFSYHQVFVFDTFQSTVFGAGAQKETWRQRIVVAVRYKVREFIHIERIIVK